MSVQHAIQKGISDFSFIIGTGLKYGGGFGLLVMAAVGTVAIDIVLLAAAEKHHNHFLTGFVLGSMFSRGHIDPVPLLIASPITSAVAVVLSFALGVPGVGLGILIGWGVAAGVLALGFGLTALAKAIDPDPELEDGYPSLTFGCC
ncbi:hypothetical protein [Legionella fallonii]|uniref:Uncharacterized protein n=1 Tax=Legionella fallonii LLAP-10 TaxID=1212491 RepID=A0A098G328_9GAMM|nr:hypothetical protein [Legionella fallonii]CEG56391.1 conserved membrane protein of unknown function [Legionella fallonii LLAP-10]